MRRGNEAPLGGRRVDEHDLGFGVAQDVGGLFGIEVEVHRHRRRAAEQRAEVSQRSLGRVLSEHRDPAVRAEVSGHDVVRAAVEQGVDLGPRQGFVGVNQRVGRRVNGCSALREFGHYYSGVDSCVPSSYR